MKNKEQAIKMLEVIQDSDALVNRGDIIQGLQDVIEFINKNL